MSGGPERADWRDKRPRATGHARRDLRERAGAGGAEYSRPWPCRSTLIRRAFPRGGRSRGGGVEKTNTPTAAPTAGPRAVSRSLLRRTWDHLNPRCSPDNGNVEQTREESEKTVSEIERTGGWFHKSDRVTGLPGWVEQAGAAEPNSAIRQIGDCATTRAMHERLGKPDYGPLDGLRLKRIAVTRPPPIVKEGIWFEESCWKLTWGMNHSDVVKRSWPEGTSTISP